MVSCTRDIFWKFQIINIRERHHVVTKIFCKLSFSKFDVYIEYFKMYFMDIQHMKYILMYQLNTLTFIIYNLKFANNIYYHVILRTIYTTHPHIFHK